MGEMFSKSSRQQAKHTEILEEILDVYFITPERLIPYLQGMDREGVLKCFADILHRYATDVNSSTLRELFTLFKAGCKPTPGKLGYNGEDSDGRRYDVKPINIRSGSGNKLNGGGNFSDFTYERLERYLKDGVIMLVSGFVDGRLLYILKFPFSYLEGEIRRQLDRFFQIPRRPGQYLRSASFSFKHYKESPDLRVIYRVPNLDNSRQFLTKDLFLYLRKEQ